MKIYLPAEEEQFKPDCTNANRAAVTKVNAIIGASGLAGGMGDDGKLQSILTTGAAERMRSKGQSEEGKDHFSGLL